MTIQFHFRCAPGLVWTRESDHILVVAQESGQVWILRGTEALIWEWLGVGYSYPKLLALLMAIDSLTGEAAAAQLSATLHRWLNEHLIEEQHD